MPGQRKGKGSVFSRHTKRRYGRPKYRPLDFYEKNTVVRGVIRHIKHESGRGAPIAIGMYTGQTIHCGKKAHLKIGNVLPIGEMQEGTICCNVEEHPGDGGHYARASGESCLVMSHLREKGKTKVKFPSGCRKTLSSNCRGMVGIIGGSGRCEKPVLKAGNNFWHWKAKGKKNWPKTRGVAKNPVDHPFGGGNHQHIGRPSTIGRRIPAGAKVGLIAARRSGRIQGSRDKKFAD